MTCRPTSTGIRSLETGYELATAVFRLAFHLAFHCRTRFPGHTEAI